MAEIKNKIVTVESLGTVYNELNDSKLSLSGGTLSGALEFNEGYGRILANATQSQIETRNVAGNTDNRRVINVRNSDAGVGLQYALSLLDVVDGNTTTYHVHGTHNKPSGQYTGNGSATSRTINVGGIGKCLLIIETNCIALVSSMGAVLFRIPNSTTYYYQSNQINFSNGILTIATDSASINYDGGTYYYQVL